MCRSKQTLSMSVFVKFNVKIGLIVTSAVCNLCTGYQSCVVSLSSMLSVMLSYLSVTYSNGIVFRD